MQESVTDIQQDQLRYKSYRDKIMPVVYSAKNVKEEEVTSTARGRELF